MKMTKKNTLFISIVGAGIFLGVFCLIYYSPCKPASFQESCYQLKHNVLNPVFSYLFIFPSFLFLSLLTYRMRDEVFRAWWNFARWWVPIIILVTYLQSTQGGGGGLGIGGAISSGFDALVLGFFYAVLVIVSLWRIVRKYRQLKRGGEITEQ